MHSEHLVVLFFGLQNIETVGAHGHGANASGNLACQYLVCLQHNWGREHPVDGYRVCASAFAAAVAVVGVEVSG